MFTKEGTSKRQWQVLALLLGLFAISCALFNNNMNTDMVADNEIEAL